MVTQSLIFVGVRASCCQFLVAVKLFSRFAGGRLSLCYNALDRHVDEGKGDQDAIIWDSAITGQKRNISNLQLQKEVSQAQLRFFESHLLWLHFFTYLFGISFPQIQKNVIFPSFLTLLFFMRSNYRKQELNVPTRSIVSLIEAEPNFPYLTMAILSDFKGEMATARFRKGF